MITRAKAAPGQSRSTDLGFSSAVLVQHRNDMLNRGYGVERISRRDWRGSAPWQWIEVALMHYSISPTYDHTQGGLL
ncbi:hypothetical protein [Streptomyces griseorubiginosus]|uniref:hypothetical protein n=1 Tax=Streptomyces griseorubiginosus TaxID=67304 RepID=UPI001AD69AA4|nr:hypothetical protein [Streptomyces griseorubiginosus]